MKKGLKLFIDDERFPEFIGGNSKDFIIKRNYEDTIKFLGGLLVCPSFISFDHDLGLLKDNTIGKTGFDIAKWLIEYDIFNNGEFIGKDFLFNIHSMNPIGGENIKGLLNNYLEFKKKELY